MKNNGPVSQNEINYSETETFVSTTDVKGIITSANDSFVRISGYALEELIGKNHNLVRHPDMPAWAFQDMWDTLKQGRPWRGIVKNRAKSGDHYWVQATVSPIIRQNKIVGYLSLRKKPARSAVTQAEALYRSAPATGPRRQVSFALWFQNLSLQYKLQLLLQPVILILLSSLTFYIYGVIKQGILDEAYSKGRGVSMQVIDGANMLMITGTISDPETRKTLLKKVIEGQSLQSLRLLRSKQVAEQYGPGLPEEHMDDPVVNRVLEESIRTGVAKPYYAMENKDGKWQMRVVAPYLFSHDFHGTNCLTCHLAKENSAGCASDFTFDLTDKFVTLRHILWTAIVTQIAIQLALFILISWSVRRFVLRPVQEISADIHDIVDGDFSKPTNISRKDEMGVILCSVQSIKVLMGAVVDQIMTATRRIDQNLELMTESVASAGHVSHQQSTATQEMAAAINQISASIDQVMENSAHAMQSSTQSEKIAMQGGEKVKEIISDMVSVGSEVIKAAASIEELGQLSSQIGGIIGTIRTIAEQTNLLALNAAIEAARAGEQGRGFAVVADEVRKLAEQTSRSTGTIEKVVSAIQQGTEQAVAQMNTVVQRVQHGEKIAQDAGQGIDEIQSGASGMKHEMEGITNAIREQDLAGKDIASNVERLAGISEQNASVIDKVESAAEVLRGLSRDLRSYSEKFRL